MVVIIAYILVIVGWLYVGYLNLLSEKSFFDNKYQKIQYFIVWLTLVLNVICALITRIIIYARG